MNPDKKLFLSKEKPHFRRSAVWWTVQDSNPSSGFRVLFCYVLRSFFVLLVQCIVLFDALWVLAVLLP